MQGSEQPS
ncbi:hypothetical protein E2C01_097816 [Portunus trituberculatus]|uniref:Uncharacterized protein n=1 Tax=Portunus trituberculatus TaxID=210409 RepID=A0A5B7KCD0_PORTR|nr:hypothetical protein [Portunus trituberculatus]